MVKVTQNFNNQLMNDKVCNFKYLIQLSILALMLYTPVILNTNIEQEEPNMTRSHTPKEVEFKEYFRRIDKSAINEILSIEWGG